MLYISLLDDFYPVKTFFTVKEGGFSTGSYASLNMGANSGDDPETVKKNRDHAFRSSGIHITGVSYPVQVHGDRIQVIRKNDTAGLNKAQNSLPYDVFPFPDTDAAVTDMPGMLLTSLQADCIPVWLYDSEKNIAGLAHAGWRGTRADIAAKTLSCMSREFGTKAGDVTAVIGPGIGSCCFEVGTEVFESFRQMLPDYAGDFARKGRPGKYMLDLKKINHILLERAGAGRIYESGLCTCCRDDLFFSYRRDGFATGRMCAGICLI